MVDGETACRDEARLVFAVDQPAFDVGPNRFCVLYPLMTIDGDRVERPRRVVPLPGPGLVAPARDVPTDQVSRGRSGPGTIEPARAGEKDQFQARFHEIHPGDADLIEILDVPQADPGLEWVHRQKGLPWPRPTTARVLLRGRSSTLGPLNAIWDPAGGRLKLSAISPRRRRKSCRVPIDVFQRLARVEDFSIELGEHTRNPSDRKAMQYLPHQDRAG